MSRRRLNLVGLYVVAFGIVLILIQVIAGVLFGWSVMDVLLVRDGAFVYHAAISHVIILYGIWLAVKPFFSPNDCGDL